MKNSNASTSGKTLPAVTTGNPTKKSKRRNATVAPGIDTMIAGDSGGPLQFSAVSLFATAKPALSGAVSEPFTAGDFGLNSSATRPFKFTSLRAAVVSDTCPIVFRLKNALDEKSTSKVLQVNGAPPHFVTLPLNPSADYDQVGSGTKLCEVIIDAPMVTTGGVQILVEGRASVGFTFS